MKIVLRCTVLGLLITSAAGLAQVTPEEEARLLAPRATDYAIKHRLLRLGTAAAPPLLEQLSSPNAVLAFESRSILRWVTNHASAEEQAGLRERYAGTLGSEDPAARAFVAELLGIIGGDEVLPLLTPLLRDEGACAAAADAINHVPGPAGTHALTGALKTESPLIRATVAKALGYRGDRAAIRALVAAAKSRDDEVRIAVWDALAALGDAEGEEAIREGTTTGRRRMKAAALTALTHLADAYHAAGRREEANTLYTEVLVGSHVRATIEAALLGLGKTGGPDDAPKLSPFLSHESASVQVAAVSALAQLPGAAAAEALAGALKADSHTVRYCAAAALAVRDAPRGIPTLVEMAGGDDPGLAEVALRALGRVSDTAAIQAVAEGMSSETALVKDAALLSAISIAQMMTEEGRAQEAAQLHSTVLDQAANDDQRIAALHGLGAAGDPAALPQVHTALETEGRVADAAAMAYLGIAQRIAAADKQQAIDAYLRALDLLPPGPLREVAWARLRELGVAISPPEGFVTDWHVIGPFTEGDEGAGTAHPFAEQPVNLTKTYDIGGREAKWISHRTPNDGHLDLLPLLDPNTNCSAYAFAEVVVEQEQDVYLKIGSDDGVAIWLNGEKLHENIVPRGLNVDEDRVEAHLNAGANKLLAHVQNGGGGWDLAVRITNLRNRPVRFRMTSE